MKPLLKDELKSFVLRFNKFIDAEVRSIDITSATNIDVVIACQDSLRGFDWLSISLEFCNVIDASVVENSKLSFIDLSEGIDIRYENSSFIFEIKNATIFINSSSIKYEEGLF
jgi:hypothetical protein